MKKSSMLTVAILLLFSSFSYAQYTFDFESNTQQYPSGPDESTVEQIVNGVTVTITTDNNTSQTKYTQITDVTGVVQGVSGNIVTTSWRNNTFYFEFSEPVYLGTILADRIGAGYIQQIITDNTTFPIRTKSTHHVGTKVIPLGWENVTAFSIENDVTVTAIPIFDDITFIPMDEFVNTVTYVPDDVFEQKLIDNGWDDVLDDYVATPNIVFQIILDVTGVEDLTGIEDFSSLRYFYCRDSPNLIGELDLTNNLNLEAVSVANSGITDLKLSTNSALQYLAAPENSLTDISLPLDADLIRVELDQNNLSELDFSYYPSLSHLELDDNSLTSLNFKNENNNDVNHFSAVGNPDLTCVLVDEAVYSTANWTNIDAQTNFNEISCSVAVAPKVFLQGAMLNPFTGEENWMRDDLRIAGGTYGATSPYGDGAMMSESIRLDDADGNSTVDWVWVELRDAANSNIVIAGKSGVLQRDGDVVDVVDNRISPLIFDVPAGDYYVSINHRNHLGIMTAAAVHLSNTSAVVDLSISTIVINGGANSVIDMGNGILAMIGGDYDENGQIQSADLNAIVSQLGTSGYTEADIDMNGEIQTTDISLLLIPNLGKGQSFD